MLKWTIYKPESSTINGHKISYIFNFVIRESIQRKKKSKSES